MSSVRRSAFYTGAFAVACVACQTTPNGGEAASSGVNTPPGAPIGTSTTSTTYSDHADHADHDCASHAAVRPPPPPGASARSLPVGDVSRVDNIRVSAHIGGVLLRKRDGVWTSVGKRGCRVPEETVMRALNNLTQVGGGQRMNGWPADVPFEMQVDVLAGEETLIHFELSPRHGAVDIVQLLNGDVFELQGLDRTAWTSDAAAWCP